MHYYQFNIGDYASHTRYLTPMQDLIYRRLLDLYYLSEKPIPKENPETLIGLNDCSTDVQRVLKMFFDDASGRWVNKRADKDIFAYKSKLKQASDAGKKSGEARKANKHEPIERSLNARLTDVEPTINHKPITINQEPMVTAKEKKKTAKPINPDLEFLDEWKDFCYQLRPDLNANEVFATFKDYWLSNGAKKADWDATWRGWVRRQKKEQNDVAPWQTAKRQWVAEMTGQAKPYEKDIFDIAKEETRRIK